MSLINKLPRFDNNIIVKEIQSGLDIEIEILKKEIEEVFAQLFVETATWGLEYWEKMIGISKNTLDYITRRENIKAKMRSRGTTSIQVIKNISEAYSNGEVDIIIDGPKFKFYVKFIGTMGIPAALDELNKTIEEIKPCHLEHEFIFSYLTWDQYEKYNYTWDKWDSLNLMWNEFEVYSGKGVV